MQKTKIEWADMTWNPVTGCFQDCPYCYAQRIANRFAGNDAGVNLGPGYAPTAILEKPLSFITKSGKSLQAPYPFGFAPTFHRYRLEQPQKQIKPQNIFVCSMADLFGKWVPDDWIETVFNACQKAPQHRYFFLTKNPERYVDLADCGRLPVDDTFWYGSTATAPAMLFFLNENYHTFVSLEPLLQDFQGDFRLKRMDWIIVGAMTGPGSKERQPKPEWVHSITEIADEHQIPVFMKDSLIPVVGEENMRREFPWKGE